MDSDALDSAVSRRGALRIAATGVSAVALSAGFTRWAAPARATSAAPAADPLGCAPRYLGYQKADYAQPYARFFTGRTSPVPSRVTKALARGPVNPALAFPHSALDAEMAEPGYSRVETGYTMLPNGQAWIACLTDMPGVRPHMWDWWFGWHSSQSARYKLWHPSAHAFASLKEDRTTTPGLSDRERYQGNTSYVDEYIGPHLEQLAINFLDPVAEGFPRQALTGTLIYGHVGSSTFPINLGFLCHQVRPTRTGCEMRSRFYLNALGLRPFDAQAAKCSVVRGLSPIPKLPFDNAFAADLLHHCGAEMHHLSTFLPQLHAAFSRRRS